VPPAVSRVERESKRIIAQQKAAADVMLAEEISGQRIKGIEHAEDEVGMRQQVPLS
jgi:hypothetical protein